MLVDVLAAACLQIFEAATADDAVPLLQQEASIFMTE
jgi:hypothetical protein